jgi:hypothetical protein
MSDRKLADARTIHPRALADLGEEACIVTLGVARDLRSGAIPPEQYDQNYFDRWQTECGTACCIAGWMTIRGVNYAQLLRVRGGLFGTSYRRRTPNEAADAIERYICDGSHDPWELHVA